MGDADHPISIAQVSDRSRIRALSAERYLAIRHQTGSGAAKLQKE